MRISPQVREPMDGLSTLEIMRTDAEATAIPEPPPPLSHPD